LNKLKELANEPTTVTKIIKKGDNFCLLQLHINKKRKFLKIERWVEVGTFSNYEQIKRLQKTIEQTWNKSND
jgi:hypothetical protein